MAVGDFNGDGKADLAVANRGNNVSVLLGTWRVSTTTTTLVATPNPSALGQSVTLTATVSPSAATGQVTFYDGTTVLGVGTLAGGTATLTTSLLPAGSRSLRAYYGGRPGLPRQHIGVGIADGERAAGEQLSGGGELRGGHWS